jgi:hypothetical protein
LTKEGVVVFGNNSCGQIGVIRERGDYKPAVMNLQEEAEKSALAAAEWKARQQFQENDDDDDDDGELF